MYNFELILPRKKINYTSLLCRLTISMSTIKNSYKFNERNSHICTSFGKFPASFIREYVTKRKRQMKLMVIKVGSSFQHASGGSVVNPKSTLPTCAYYFELIPQQNFFWFLFASKGDLFVYLFGIFLWVYLAAKEN